MFFNFIVVTLWCVEEDKFGDRSGQTATVWILARCYLPTEADGTLLLLILDTLHTQTITSPRAVFLKYVQLYLFRVYFWYFATSGTWQSGQRDNLADTRRILPSAFFSLLSLFFLFLVIFWLSYQGDFLKSIDHICR